MPNLCKTCVHWNKPLEVYPMGIFRASELAGGYCKSDKIVERAYQAAYDLDSLTYPYDEGADFWTGPDFGCVHHKEKSDA